MSPNPPAGLFLPLLLVLLTLPGCALLFPDDGSVGCTLEFRSYTVLVVDAGGQPLDSLTATVRNLRTGEVFDLDPINAFLPEAGRYLVVTDSQQDRLSERGDRVLFRAEGGGMVAEAAFVFSGGPCHVEKMSGPERIVAQPA